MTGCPRNGTVPERAEWPVMFRGDERRVFFVVILCECERVMAKKEIYYNGADDVDLNHCLQFLDQPGAKPVFALSGFRREIIDNALDRLKQTFSSAVSPNAYKIVFLQVDEPLTEFRETNKTSGEVLELTKGLPVEYPEEFIITSIIIP